MRRLLWHVSRTTLWSAFALLVLLALLSLAGRLLIHKVDDYRRELATELGTQLGGRVQIASLRGGWQGAHPLLLIEGVEVEAAPEPILLAADQRLPEKLPALVLDRARVQLDLWQSLSHLQPVVRRLELEGVRLRLEQWESGALTLEGFDPTPRTQADQAQPPAAPLWQQLLQPLLLQRRLALHELEIKIRTRSGATRWLAIPELEYRGGGWEQQLKTRLQLDDNPEISLSLRRHGNPERLEAARLSGYLDWPQQSLSLWLELLPEELVLKQLEGGGRFWLSHRGQEWRFQGQLQLPELDLQLPGALPAPRMANLSSDFTLIAKGSEDWALWLDQLQGRIEGQELNLQPLYLRARAEGLQIATEALELAPLKEVALAWPGLSPAVQSLLGALNPAGRMTRVSAFIDPTRPEQFELAAGIEGLSVDAWQGAPSASGIAGQLRMSGLQGEFELDAETFSLGLTELFDAPWRWSRAQGRLSWFVDDQRFTLLGRGLRVSAPIGAVKGALRLDFPFDERPDEMGLLLAIEQADATLAERYVPAKILPETLDHWLNQAIQGGRVSDGVFLYNGAISKTEHATAHSYDMYYRGQELAVDYAPPWPAVREADALVRVTNNRVAVAIERARVLDQGTLSGARVWYDGNPVQPLLRVTGAVAATGSDGLRVLRESPLATLLGGVADHWTLAGNLEVGLDLGIGLAPEVDDRLAVEVEAREAALYIDQADLWVKDVQGRVRYDSTDGLSSQGLQGQLLGQPAQIAITGRDGGRYTRIAVDSEVDTQALRDWLGFDWLALANGRSTYRAALEIVPDQAPTLEISSALKGMALALPDVLAKPARTPMPSTLQLVLRNPMEIAFSLGTSAHGVLAMAPEGHLQRGRVRFGRKGRLQLPGAGLHLDGRLPALELAALQRWYDAAPWRTGNSGAGTERSSEAWPNLTIDRLEVVQLTLADDFVLRPLTLGLRPERGGYRLDIESPELAGSLLYPGAEGRWTLNLARLYLPSAGETGSAEEARVTVDPLQAVNPAELPPLNLAIADIRIGARELGRLQAELSPHPRGVHLFNLNLEMPDLHVQGDLSWNYEQRLHGTTSKLQFKSANLARLVRRWGFESGAEARSSQLDLDWYWPGSPLALTSERIRGTMAVTMDKGRFVALDPKANVLKIFGVLNFGSITRRLQLDFSDLFQEGVAFDRVAALMRFEQGRVHTQEPITIDGPSSSFRMHGWYDLGSNQTDMRLAVTLPVTQNLPLIAVLMGLPQVGGAIFLADKLLGDRVQRFASVRYRIHGDLNEPKVEFDKAFTNKT